MPRKKKKKKDPLLRFEQTAKIILETGKFVNGVDTILLQSIDRLKDKTYECTLTFKGRINVYSHVTPAKTKLESVKLAVEHLDMMGNGGLSYEEDEDE